MVTLAREVAREWARQGVVRDGVDADALDRLEARRGIALPATFRALWGCSDGTAAMDDGERIFWPLDNIADDPSLPPAAHPAQHLVFADWRLAAAVYRLGFDVGRAGGVTVVRADALTFREVAPSFDDFLARYLAEPSSLGLHGPGRRVIAFCPRCSTPVEAAAERAALELACPCGVRWTASTHDV
jgi:hypothetical protein